MVRSQRDTASIEAAYRLFGSRQSYFTMKVQAALSWYFPNSHSFEPKGLLESSDKEEIELRSGTHQVPVLITPEDWCIADSTPILALLDSRMAEARFYPAGITGLLTMLLEEFFDEWSARWCISCRWMNGSETAMHASAAMFSGSGMGADTAAKAQEQTWAWGKRAARAIGVNSSTQQAAADSELTRIFSGFEQHLASGHRFVFGDYPTAVDCVMMGGLRAHFLHDLHPRQLLGQLPLVNNWADRSEEPLDHRDSVISPPPKEESDDEDYGTPIWEAESELYAEDSLLPSVRPSVGSDAGSGYLSIGSADSLPPFVSLVLAEMGGAFRAFVQGNRRAVERGEKSFVAEVHGEQVSYLCRPYVEKSRRMLVQRLQLHGARVGCSAHERAVFEQVLEAAGLQEVYGVGQQLLVGASL